jgi:flagellar hook-length control protein FliK
VATTRQLLEQSLPSLASALREAGFTLSGGGVFQQSRQGFADEGAAASSPGRGAGSGDDSGPAAAIDGAAPSRTLSRGLVDVFA